MYNVQWTVYNVHCTLLTVHCEVRSSNCPPMSPVLNHLSPAPVSNQQEQTESSKHTGAILAQNTSRYCLRKQRGLQSSPFIQDDLRSCGSKLVVKTSYACPESTQNWMLIAPYNSSFFCLRAECMYVTEWFLSFIIKRVTYNTFLMCLWLWRMIHQLKYKMVNYASCSPGYFRGVTWCCVKWSVTTDCTIPSWAAQQIAARTCRLVLPAHPHWLEAASWQPPYPLCTQENTF